MRISDDGHLGHVRQERIALRAADRRRGARAPGGAVGLLRTGGSAADGAAGGNGHAASTPPPAALPPSLQRTTLAELALPLERHRLVALVQSVEERARRTGRSKASSEPERGAGMRG